MSFSQAQEPSIRASIRPAQNVDVQAIWTLIQRAYAKYIPRLGRLPSPMETDVAVLVNEGNFYVLGIDPIEGAVRLNVIGGSILVSNLVVDPSAQGKGYGRHLMEFAETTARTLRVLTMSLDVSKVMHENIDFYRRLGFSETVYFEDRGFKRIRMQPVT